MFEALLDELEFEALVEPVPPLPALLLEPVPPPPENSELLEPTEDGCFVVGVLPSNACGSRGVEVSDGATISISRSCVFCDAETD